jgi:hypothetical protein
MAGIDNSFWFWLHFLLDFSPHDGLYTLALWVRTHGPFPSPPFISPVSCVCYALYCSTRKRKLNKLPFHFRSRGNFLNRLLANWLEQPPTNLEHSSCLCLSSAYTIDVHYGSHILCPCFYVFIYRTQALKLTWQTSSPTASSQPHLKRCSTNPYDSEEDLTNQSHPPQAELKDFF